MREKILQIASELESPGGQFQSGGFRFGPEVRELGSQLRTLIMTPQEVTAKRTRLGDQRKGVTHKFNLGEHRGYITVGLYPDGTPGEVFIKMAKIGSTISGLLDSISILASMLLQYGVPLSLMCDKLERTRFEPDGYSGSEFHFATSILDYVFRYLRARYCSGANSPAVVTNESSSRSADSGNSDGETCSSDGLNSGT